MAEPEIVSCTSSRTQTVQPSQAVQVMVQPCTRQRTNMHSESGPVIESQQAVQENVNVKDLDNLETSLLSKARLLQEEDKSKGGPVSSAELSTQSKEKPSLYTEAKGTFKLWTNMLFELHGAPLVFTLSVAIICYLQHDECNYAVRPEEEYWSCFSEIEPTYTERVAEYTRCTIVYTNFSWGKNTIRRVIKWGDSVFFWAGLILYFPTGMYGWTFYDKFEQRLIKYSYLLMSTVCFFWFVLLGQNVYEQSFTLCWFVYTGCVFIFVGRKIGKAMPHVKGMRVWIRIWLICILVYILFVITIPLLYGVGANDTRRLFVRLFIWPLVTPALVTLIRYYMTGLDEALPGMECLFSIIIVMIYSVNGRFLLLQTGSTSNTTLVCVFLGIMEIISHILIRDPMVFILRLFYGNRLAESILAVRRNVNFYMSERWLFMMAEYLGILGVSTMQALLNFDFRRDPENPIVTDKYIIFQNCMIQLVVQYATDIINLAVDKVFHGYDHTVLWKQKVKHMWWYWVIVAAPGAHSLVNFFITTIMCPVWHAGSQQIVHQFCMSDRPSFSGSSYFGYKTPSQCSQGTASPLFGFEDSYVDGPF